MGDFLVRPRGAALIFSLVSCLVSLLDSRVNADIDTFTVGS